MAIRPLIAVGAALLFALPNLALAAPPIAETDARSTPVDTPISINVLNNDSDPDGDAIELISVSDPANGTATISPDGGVFYSPDAGFEGTDTFSYVVQDSSAAAEMASGQVVVRVSNGTFSLLPIQGNDNSVAAALDSACAAVSAIPPAEQSAGTAQLAEGCLYLQNLSANDPDAAAVLINQIAPEETLALLRTASGGIDTQTAAVTNRLGQLGPGIQTISINGLSWSSDQPLGGAAGDLDDLFSRVGVFANIQIEGADKDKTELENGFDYSALSFTLGADYGISPDWFAGAAFGYTSNDLDYTNNNGSVSADILSVIAYTNYNYNNLSVDVQLGFGSANYDINRVIVFPGEAVETVRTSGSTTGSQWFLTTQAHYLWSYNALTLYPSARLNYLSSGIDTYAELNAEGFEVVLSDQEIQQLVAQVGVQAQYAMTLDWGVFLPLFEINALSEVVSDQQEVVGRFAFAPGDTLPFVLTPEGKDTLFFQTALGASAILPHGLNAYFTYRHLFGYDDFEAFQLQLGLRYEI